MLEGDFVLIRQNNRNASALDALVQLVRPRRGTGRYQAKVGIALDLQVVGYEAALVMTQCLIRLQFNK